LSITLSAIQALPNETVNSSPSSHVYELGQEIFRRQNIEVKFDFQPFKRALVEASTGVTNGMYSIYFTPERNKSLAYSKKIHDVDVVFFGLKRKIQAVKYNSLRDLSGLTIGALRTAANGKAFADAGYLNKIFTTNKIQGIKMLRAERIDLWLDVRSFVQRTVNLSFPKLKPQLVILDPPLLSRGIYATFSRKLAHHQKLVREFNLGLKKTLEDGTAKRIWAQRGMDFIRHSETAKPSQ